MTIDDNIRDETLQYDINREAAKISALSSGKIDVNMNTAIRLNIYAISAVATGSQGTPTILFRVFFLYTNKWLN